MEGAAPARGPGIRHAAVLHRGAADFGAAVGGYVRVGLLAGESVLVVARDRIIDALRAQLDDRSGGLAVASLNGSGVNPGRVLSVIRQFTHDHDSGPVRCVQELAWSSRPRDEVREAMRHEALIDLALGSARANVLCGYEASLDPVILAGAERIHPVIVRDGRWHASQPHPAASGDPGDEGLDNPPATAAQLRYREDQSPARAFAARQAGLAGLTPARTADLVLAVGELTANTLAHTAGPGTLTAWTTGAEFICQVRDSGEIADPLAGTLRPSPVSPQRGRGLWIVHQLCDLVETRTGTQGTTTRLHMRLHTAASDLAPEAPPAARRRDHDRPRQ